MKYDIPLLLLSLFAGISTFLLISVHVVWIALTMALRKKGCRVTLLKHDWQKVKEAIAGVSSPVERNKYERWDSFLRYSYLAWGMMMLLFVLLIAFIYN